VVSLIASTLAFEADLSTSNRVKKRGSKVTRMPAAIQLSKPLKLDDFFPSAKRTENGSAYSLEGKTVGEEQALWYAQLIVSDGLLRL
jgi:hypothetical protein